VSLSLQFDTVLQMRKALIRATALEFSPDVLLVDHMPHGSMGELVPTLEALDDFPTRKILGLRDILDAPDTIHRRWKLEGAFAAVERHFDQVLVYGSQKVFDVAAQYRWPAHLAERLHYCGYVCARPTGSPKRLRKRYLQGMPADTKLIVAMAGGGADAYPLFETLSRAIPAVTSRHRCAFVFVTGPFLPDAQRAQLQQRAEGLPLHVLRTVSDSLAYMGAADLVIAMAGYNTTAEILKLGTRSLLVPRPGPSAEQQMRASRLAERGWVNWLPPESLSAEALASAIIATIDEPRAAAGARPDLLGLQRAARHLVGESVAETGIGSGPGLATPGPRRPGHARMLDEA